MIAAHGVALQRVAVVFLQLVVQAAAVKHGAALFIAVFPVHFPQQKGAELCPEAELIDAGRAQHGGILLQPAQPLPGTGVSAYHAGQLDIEALERRQLQQKAADGQIEPAINGGFEVEKDLVVALGHQLRAVVAAIGHAVGCYRHPQRVAAGLPQDLGDHRFPDRGALPMKQCPDILPIPEQGIGIQHRHEAGILEGHEPARHRPAGKQDEPAVAVLPDELVQRLLIRLLGHLLQVVYQQYLPALVIGGQSKAGLSGMERKDLAAGKQRAGQGAFSAAAGRTEKQHPAPCHEFIVLFPGQRPDEHIFCHAVPPCAAACSRGAPREPKRGTPLLEIINMMHRRNFLP